MPPPAAVSAAAAAARAFLRLGQTGEDALLERMAASAIGIGEAFTGTLFVRRAVEDVLPASDAWQMLAQMPVTAIAGVTALPVTGAPFVLPPAAYAIDIDDGRGWVRFPHGAARTVAVGYVAGLAETWEALPAPLAQGTVALIAHLFEDRAQGAQPPAAVAALWRPYRRLSLGGAVPAVREGRR